MKIRGCRNRLPTPLLPFFTGTGWVHVLGRNGYKCLFWEKTSTCAPFLFNPGKNGLHYPFYPFLKNLKIQQLITFLKCCFEIFFKK